MKSQITLFVFLSLLSSPLLGQVSVSLGTGEIPTEANVTIFEGGTCYTSDFNGVEGQSSVDLNVDIVSGIKSAVNYLLDGKEIDPKDFITPTFKCTANLMHLGGQVNSYLVTLSKSNVLDKEVTGNISVNDVLKVYSPVATTLHIPLHVNASVVSIQTFCDPTGSEAEAKAEVSVTLGGTTTTVTGRSFVAGAFLDNDYPDETKTASVMVPAGVSTVTLKISGTLTAHSKVMGLSDDFPLACGSNAVASAGNSLTVGYFTGPNGAALPTGTKIIGLITGINYTDPQKGNTCQNAPTATITTVPASCGNANGSASISVNSSNSFTVKWSNSQTGLQTNALPIGNHYAIVDESNGCSTIFPFTISDPSIPHIELPETVKILPGNNVLLNAQDTSGKNYTYAWSTGQNTSTITINAPNIYTVTMTSNNGCTFVFEVLALDQEGYFMSDDNITADFGLFFDDGGPNNAYSPNQTHVITICPETPGRFTELKFTEVDILSTNDQDELSVFDGIGSICPLSTSVVTPQTFVASKSSGGCLTVRFRATDYDAAGAGWKALITTTDAPPQGCYVDTLTCGDEFVDPGGVNSNYPPNEYKVYYICSDKPDKKVRLSFSELQLGKGDHLAIYDGKGVSCLWEDSIVSAPRTFFASTQSGGCLTAVFDSDNSAEKTGWRASITCQAIQFDPPEYCLCRNNPPPADHCADAPFINNLESFCGESSIYYDGSVTGDLETEFDCGVVHNNSFIKFVPNATAIKLGYKIKGGTHRLCEGIQLGVFRINGNCEAPNANWTQVKCLNIDNGLAGEGVFDVSGLVSGQTYYLMVDGSHGSECLYTLTPQSGFATCPLNLGVENLICDPSGAYKVVIPLTGKSNGVSYTVKETQNYYGKVADQQFKDDGAASSVTVGPYPAGWPYDIQIEGGQGFAACSLQVKGKPACYIPCDLKVELKSECLGDTYLIHGTLTSGTFPLSIASKLFAKVIFPQDSSTFSFQVNGDKQMDSIRVYYTDFNQCASEEYLNLKTCLNCSEDLNLWPNPAHDIIYISSVHCEDWQIALFDVQGKRVLTGPLEYSTEQKALKMDVKNLPAGLYFIQLTQANERLARKFVKM
ncbi:MAG: T9SS type A sorting domain-containing protein [Saprospiraceae bacterium]|nr:T9SS type A sorting domain-containing protein [Saprospiraceae bacterium]